MNNDQIILWIKHNQNIYIKGTLKQYVTRIENTSDISDLLSKVTQRSFEMMESYLKDKKTVFLQDFIMFFPVIERKDNHTKKITLTYAPIGKMRNKILTPFLSPGIQKVAQKVETNELCREVSSLLWIPKQIVKELIQVYSRAIGDIISGGKEILLNFGFCKIKLSKSHLDCKFSQKILKYISENQCNKQNRQIKKNQLWLWNEGQHVCESQESQRYIKNWNMIKQGNLFDYPSLKEIQNHLQTGYNLQIKYKKKFD